MAWAGRCVGGLLSTRYRREEDDHMSDYEIVMIVLTLLIVVFTAIGALNK